MEESEKTLREELENAKTASKTTQSDNESEKASEAGQATESKKSAILDQMESKRKELV